MSLLNQLAYLKGLADGLDVNTTTKEGKIVTAIIDVLDEMALTISDLEDAVEGKNHHHMEELPYDIYTCPSCGISIELDEGMFEVDEELNCPKCGDPIELDLDYDCGCGCGDHDHDHN